MKLLDPRTLREMGRRLRSEGRYYQRESSFNFGAGFIEAGNLLTAEARAIEKRRAKKAGKRADG